MYEDVWRDALFSEGELSSPSSIIKKRISNLENVTEGLLDVSIRRYKNPNNEIFQFDCSIRCKSLNYSYSLFTFTHGVLMFPVVLRLENELKIELSLENDDIVIGNSSYSGIVCSDKGEFEEMLDFIFQSKRCLNIIRSLYMLAKEENFA